MAEIDTACLENILACARASILQLRSLSMSTQLYQTRSGIVASQNEQYAFVDASWDALFRGDSLKTFTGSLSIVHDPSAETAVSDALLPPIGSQEVWASGVTYYSSRLARMEESKSAGGSDFYSSVYVADRPELFFKSLASRVRGHGERVRIRKDSAWDVPEPELTLAISDEGAIIGYTVGNDMSSRSIEGENPLYLPQAKSYEGATGLGPCLYVLDTPIPRESKIQLSIERAGTVAFEGETQVSEMKRSLEELVGFLYRELDFANGCYLMTGTGIVPSVDFTLQSEDRISITIENLGTLVQTVE